MLLFLFLLLFWKDPESPTTMGTMVISEKTSPGKRKKPEEIKALRYAHFYFYCRRNIIYSIGIIEIWLIGCILIYFLTQ